VGLLDVDPHGDILEVVAEPGVSERVHPHPDERMSRVSTTAEN
jgi:hypothetical protein